MDQAGHDDTVHDCSLYHREGDPKLQARLGWRYLDLICGGVCISGRRVAAIVRQYHLILYPKFDALEPLWQLVKQLLLHWVIGRIGHSPRLSSAARQKCLRVLYVVVVSIDMNLFASKKSCRTTCSRTRPFPEPSSFEQPAVLRLGCAR